MGLMPFLLVPAILAVQLMSGSIGGVVKDASSGTLISGAVVTLPDIGKAAVSDSSGRYLFQDLPAGPQHMLVRRIGYAPRTLHALVPRSGVLEIDLLLRSQPIRLSKIEVEGRVPVRGLDDGENSSYPDRGMSIAAIRRHPLLAEPDPLLAAAGGEVMERPESPSGIHVRGGASDQIAYLLDGIPILNPYHAGGTFSAWNPDALSRLDLFTSSTPAPHPDALSGVVAATTRDPGSSLHGEGGFSTTQARATIDGSISRTGIGYLASVRSAFPGLVFRRPERSYLRGDGSDWLGKVESPFLAGRLRLLGYGAETEIDAASRAGGDTTAVIDPTHNTFGWRSHSWGGGWDRRVGKNTSVLVQAWSARGDANATWSRSDSLSEILSADRDDNGCAASITWSGASQGTTAGVRVEESRTSYRIRSDVTAGSAVNDSGPSLFLRAKTPEIAVFFEHRRALIPAAAIEVSITGARVDDDFYIAPGAQIRWKLSEIVNLSGGYIRRHQFAQTLRNPESVVSTIFPVDLYVGANDGGVPVARSHLGMVAADIRPVEGMRIAAQGYVRSLDGLALVAPQDSDPFALTGFSGGSGSARGVAIEASANGARYAALASYGLQRVRLTYADTTYVPEYGAAHSIVAGIIWYPSATASIRLGVTSLIGRRATASIGALEWEDCNLLDQGCEFSGSPGERAEPLGATRLPTYMRVDLGFRKHWDVHAGGRDCLLAVFGTASNLLARENVLTIAIDPSTGERTRIEMRPRSPLVVGLDWKF